MTALISMRCWFESWGESIMDELRKGGKVYGWTGGRMYLLVVTAFEKARVWRVGDIQRHLDVLFPNWYRQTTRWDSELGWT